MDSTSGITVVIIHIDLVTEQFVNPLIGVNWAIVGLKVWRWKDVGYRMVERGIKSGGFGKIAI